MSSNRTKHCSMKPNYISVLYSTTQVAYKKEMYHLVYERYTTLCLMCDWLSLSQQSYLEQWKRTKWDLNLTIKQRKEFAMKQNSLDVKLNLRLLFFKGIDDFLFPFLLVGFVSESFPASGWTTSSQHSAKAVCFTDSLFCCLFSQSGDVTRLPRGW